MAGILIFFLRILLAGLLYAFLIWALYSLWRELRTSQIMAIGKKAPAILIRNFDFDPPLEQSFNLAQVVIGRDPSCDLCISSELVSAQHARLSFHHNQWWVEDLLSTNGTYLNDERIYTPTVLMVEDELRFGKTNLQISFGESQNVKS
jgi:pSer/pThr/pTyr-binding forkhead associated (FHA) protein